MPTRFIILGIVLSAGVVAGVVMVGHSLAIESNGKELLTAATIKPIIVAASESERKILLTPTSRREHIPPPESLKAVYMTSWVAGLPDWRGRIIKMIDETELNAIIIDIKDDTGRVSFAAGATGVAPLVEKYQSVDNRIPDITELIETLHSKNIYVIGRVAVFQDPWMTKKRPDLAVQTTSGAVWEDRKGLSWIDAAAGEHWEYIAQIARAAEVVGFDEINLDYVRYPTDGAISKISLPFTGEGSKPAELEKFFAWITTTLKPLGIPISGDLFGMTTTAEDDMGIGQDLVTALKYLNYVMPMVYPSHYPDGWNGYADPNDHPGPVIFDSMSAGVARAKAAGINPDKLRAWLQDFDYGGDYDAADVRAQIDAVYQAGLDSWLLWDPNVKYTREALR